QIQPFIHQIGGLRALQEATFVGLSSILLTRIASTSVPWTVRFTPQLMVASSGNFSTTLVSLACLSITSSLIHGTLKCFTLGLIDTRSRVVSLSRAMAARLSEKALN